jgi:hypothetical protein
VATEQLAKIALDTTDTNGNQLAQNIVKSSGIPRTTIAVGSGSPTTDDYQPSDVWSSSPELANAAHIVVTD